MLKKSVLLALAALGLAVPCRASAAELSDSRRVRFTADYRLTPADASKNVRLIVVIPQNIALRQEVAGLNFSVAPARIFDEDGTRYAEFRFDRLAVPAKVSVTADLLLHRFDADSAPLSPPAAAGAELGRYTRPEPYIESDAELLRPIAAGVTGANALEVARGLFDYVRSSLKYNGYVPADTGAVSTLKRGWGDCSDYTDLLVALCRAKGIPARTVDGYLVDYGNDTPQHTWAEVYVEGRGWIPVDPLLASLGKTSFERMNPGYIYLSSVRNDRFLNRFHFYSCSFSGAPVNVEAAYSVVKG